MKTSKSLFPLIVIGVITISIVVFFVVALSTTTHPLEGYGTSVRQRLGTGDWRVTGLTVEKRADLGEVATLELRCFNRAEQPVRILCAKDTLLYDKVTQLRLLDRLMITFLTKGDEKALNPQIKPSFLGDIQLRQLDDRK